jgi:hypothetical protein
MIACETLKVLEYPELGMEAIWKIEVENFPGNQLLSHNASPSHFTLSRFYSTPIASIEKNCIILYCYTIESNDVFPWYCSVFTQWQRQKDALPLVVIVRLHRWILSLLFICIRFMIWFLIQQHLLLSMTKAMTSSPNGLDKSDRLRAVSVIKFFTSNAESSTAVPSHWKLRRVDNRICSCHRYAFFRISIQMMERLQLVNSIEVWSTNSTSLLSSSE